MSLSPGWTWGMRKSSPRPFRHMHRKGQAMILIEHRLRDLLKLVERVVAIVFGEKMAEGTPQEIMSNPKVINAYLGERRD